MKTRLLSLFVALFATTALWAYDFKSGDLYYNIIETNNVKEVAVTYEKPENSSNYAGLTFIDIPTMVTYEGTTYNVTSIDAMAFHDCTSSSITIPNSIVSIGESAFEDCMSLTSIVIPNSVTSIGEEAFVSCTSLVSVSIGNGVTSIEGMVFEDCTALTTITIPNSVTSIGNGAFSGCKGLTSITIPNSVTSIGSYAFHGCTGLTSITIPNSVTSIGRNAFNGCTGLTSITIPNSVTSIGERAFDGCTGLTSITIPNSVTSIGEKAFKSCTGLTSIELPVAGKELFWNCTSLASIVLTTNKACADSLWYYYHANFSASYEYNIRNQIKSLTFSGSVTTIPKDLCKNMSSLTSITIGNSVTSIGSSAFYGCTGLTSVTIPESVANIGSSAFYGCSNLETVEFGENVQDIGDEAFSGCQNIYEMTVRATKVPNVVAEREGRSDYGTFQGVSKLAELHVPAESVKKYKIHPVWGLFNVITAIPCVVTLNCNNVMGAVTGAGSYQANEQVNITATPNLGYRFRQWSDGITTNPRTLVVVGDTTLTAEFEEIPASEYTVSVVVDAEQNGAVQMTLTAVPDDGYQFSQWSDGNTDNPRTILVTENMTLSATFSVATNAAATPTHDDTNGTRKVFRNGHVLIQHGNKTYTTTGIEVK